MPSTKTSSLYIGLMSGTSLDGIDAALIDFSQEKNPQLIEQHIEPISTTIKQDILDLCHPGSDEINRLGKMDVILGHLFAKAASTLLKKTKYLAQDICAIGSHGQTIRHHPHQQHPFTLQIGDPNIIATQTKITTVADFRRRDIALGGQGAPLVPIFHQNIFQSSSQNRVIVNIGGIANITYLPKDLSKPIFGFDTGPGNMLSDAWTRLHLEQPHDENGEWASTGEVDEELLQNCLSDNYFSLQPPKSTGRELFHLNWLQEKLSVQKQKPENTQATLVELTAESITRAIDQYCDPDCEIFVCGGGAYNLFLLQRLQHHANKKPVRSTQELGIAPDWIEAMAFAWMAKQTLAGKPSNLPEVTGARQSDILGGIFRV